MPSIDLTIVKQPADDKSTNFSVTEGGDLSWGKIRLDAESRRRGGRSRRREEKNKRERTEAEGAEQPGPAVRRYAVAADRRQTCAVSMGRVACDASSEMLANFGYLHKFLSLCGLGGLDESL